MPHGLSPDALGVLAAVVLALLPVIRRVLWM
jgi:hypothetical protein